MRSLSFPSMQNPRSLIKFRCWSLATKRTSFLNSKSPCLEFIDNLFTAISCPFECLPCKLQGIRKICFTHYWLNTLGHMINSSVHIITFSYLVNCPKSTFPELICFRKVICRNYNSAKIELQGLHIFFFKGLHIQNFPRRISYIHI